MIHDPSHGSFAIDLFEIDQQLINKISESGRGGREDRVEKSSSLDNSLSLKIILPTQSVMN